jgi:hypothetical protein
MKDEGGIKKQSNQRPFERFRIVTKIAVSSSASLRSSPTFAAGTMPAARGYAVRSDEDELTGAEGFVTFALCVFFFPLSQL